MRIARACSAAGVVTMLMAGLVGCVPEPSSTEGPPSSATSEPTATPTATEAEAEAATFVAVVDGDTIETSEGTVRIIGIDTPERGQCGYDDASTAIGRLLAVGDSVTLELPPGQNDRDRYGRLIRYVITDAGVDLGLMQLESGNALARYDSSDGYPAHPQETAYRAAQIASPSADGSVITIACRHGTPPAIAPSTDERWWEQYSSCARLKRNEAGHPTGPFNRDDPAQAEIYDWFAYGTGNRGDGDGDGLACE